jgi:hypothetical protein
MTYALEIDDWDQLLKRIDELEQGSGPFGQMLTGTMQAALDLLEQEIVLRTPVNAGLLRGSIATAIHGRSPYIEGTVGTSISYGEPVEYGRKPGKRPPVDAIEAWVTRKGIAPEGQERQVAFLIARAIGRRGKPGAFMFRDGLAAAEPRILQLFDDLAGRIVAELAR